jgi:uncharacterized damage-inducible protein DinB
LLAQLKVEVPLATVDESNASLACSGFVHFQRRFSRFVIRSDALTPGRAFGFTAASEGCTVKRIERLTAAAIKRMRLFIKRIFPYLLALQAHKLLGMTTSLETMMRHMKWANQEIFSAISELPDEALGSYITNKDWHVAEILSHIVVATDRYVYRLNGRKADEKVVPTTMKDLKDLAKRLEKCDSELIELSKEPDRVVEVNREGVITHWQAATILSQAAHHAIEHRCQAVTALEFKGYKAPDLDDYDVWGYERSTK